MRGPSGRLINPVLAAMPVAHWKATDHIYAEAPGKHLQLIGALPKPGHNSAFTIRSQRHVIK